MDLELSIGQEARLAIMQAIQSKTRREEIFVWIQIATLISLGKNEVIFT